MVSDISNQAISWSGRFVINPFDAEDDGSLVALEHYPGLGRHLLLHEARLRARHVAKRRQKDWYRTIDRIWPALQHRPKLVIPDIQSQDATTIGLDPGRFYPHHNVYFVTSESWDLRALKTLLRSSMVLNQVRAYSVQMRGGSLRWQAQTLRRIRVPPVSSLRIALIRHLARISDSHDQQEIDAATTEAFAAAAV